MNTGVDVANNPFYGGLPQITFTGFSGYLGEGSRQSHRGPEGDVNLVETVSYLRGKHAFKFGFDYIDIIFDGNTFTTAQGVAKFGALQTFLTGNPTGGSILLGNPQTNIRSHWYGGFVQDDWRVTTRLTLNLGIRYDYATPPVERNNYIGAFNPNVNPATTAAVQQVGPGAPISSLYNGDHRDFSPRFGVAWDVKGNGKTVVRAGASLIRISSTLETLVGTVPFGANFPDINVNNSGTDINAHTPVQLSVAAASFNWNQAGPIFPSTAPQNINGTIYSGVTCTAKTPCATNNVDPNYRQPGAIEWNVDVQRAITGNLTVDAAYVGNHGYKEASWVDLNQPAIGTGWNTAWTAAQLTAAKQNVGDAGLTSAQMCLGQGPAPFCSVNTAAELGPFSAKFPYLN
jgi:hypothetical protein